MYNRIDGTLPTFVLEKQSGTVLHTIMYCRNDLKIKIKFSSGSSGICIRNSSRIGKGVVNH